MTGFRSSTRPPCASLPTGGFPKVAEAWDLERILLDYVAAAERCAAAGLDGIEVQSYGHLFDAFISPATNLREDELGGPLHARLTFPRRVIRAIRQAVGPDFVVVFATTDRANRRTSAFVVEKDTPGFDPGKLEHKLGIKGSPTGSPSFTDVRVPQENLIGEEGKGLSVALGTLKRTRLGAAAQAVGIAQGATDYANSYAAERIAFGKPINQLQAIQFKLADMETGTAAARELRLYKACSMADKPQRPADLGKWTSMAKLFASDNAMKATVEAIQVLGGYGYVNEYPVERMMRDAKITQIYEGTNEIQRVVIARSMAG